jgi:hypothetical protein
MKNPDFSARRPAFYHDERGMTSEKWSQKNLSNSIFLTLFGPCQIKFTVQIKAVAKSGQGAEER